MSETLFDRLASEVTDILAPLTDAVSDPYWLNSLISQLGVEDGDPAVSDILTALQAVLTLKNNIIATANNPSPSFADVAALLKSMGDAFTAIRALSEAGGAAQAFESLGEDLVQLLLGFHIGDKYPLLYHLSVLLTLIEPAENMTPTAPVIDASGNIRRGPIVYPAFHLDRLSQLFQDPISLLKAEYVNGLATVADSNAMADKLFPRVGAVLNALGVPNRYGILDGARPLLGIAAPLVDHSLLVYLQNRFDGTAADAGVCFALSSADNGNLGLVVIPFGGLNFTVQAGDWALEFTLTADVQAFAYGRNGLTLLASGSSVDVAGSFKATLPKPSDGPAFLLGAAQGTRIEIGDASSSATVALSASAMSVKLDAGVPSAAIVVAPGDGDGFLQAVLPANGARCEFDLGIAWTNDHGLTIRGAAGLDATLPAGLSVGPISVQSIHVGLHADGGGISFECSATAGLSLGPVQVLVDRMGVLVGLHLSSGGWQSRRCRRHTRL